MDVRRQRFLAAVLPLFISANGCLGFGNKLPTGNPDLAKFEKEHRTHASAPSPTATRAVSSDAKRKEQAKPETLCAIAAVRDNMANNPDLSFAEAEQTHAAARQMYQQAIAMDPKYIPAYVGLAKSYAAIDDGAQAAKMYDKALAQQPHDAGLWFEKAKLQARFKDLDGAAASLKQAQKIDPDNRNYGRMLGLTQARAGHFDEAMQTLSKCMKEEEARYNLARMYQHMDRPTEAKEQLNLALKAHPTYEPAQQMLVEIQQPAPTGMNAVATVAHVESAK